MFMQLSVGSYTYRVVVVEQLQHPDTGDRVDGFCDYRGRRIYIDSDLDADQRRLALRHEFCHAFEFLAGPTRNSEEVADRSAWVNDELDQQMDSIGGWDVFHQLFKPQPTTSMPREAPPGVRLNPSLITVSRFECRHCGLPNMLGDVRKSPAKFDRELQRYTSERWFECHTCNGENRWTEYCSETGLFTGEAVPERAIMPQQAARPDR
jgi:hypothetical protein